MSGWLAVAVAVAAFVLGLAIGRLRPRRRPTLAVAARETRPDGLPALVVRASTQGVVVLDRDERVLLANPAAHALGVLSGGRVTSAQLTGMAESALNSRRPPPQLIDLPLARIGRDAIAVAAVAVELPVQDELGRPSAVALLLEDVTENRRLEAVRRDFVANVSHELKTPVGALTLLAEAIQDAADDREAVARFAARMQHEGSRLGKLVRELIELSRLQGAEPLPGTTEVPVHRVLDEAADRVRLVAERAGIAVVVRAQRGVVVSGSETQLTNAIVNLLDNAIAYSPAGTRVAVSARADEQRGSVDITVSDQGIGIAEADRDRVFERFYRVDQARSRATGGTGLGLAIVKHVAANHGGDVTVWSQPGEGSTFTIRLPLVHLGAPPSGADPADAGPYDPAMISTARDAKEPA